MDARHIAVPNGERLRVFAGHEHACKPGMWPGGSARTAAVGRANMMATAVKKPVFMMAAPPSLMRINDPKPQRSGCDQRETQTVSHSGS